MAEQEVEQTQAIEKSGPRPVVAMGRKGFEPTTMEEAYRMATWMSQSDIVPQRYQNNPGSCMIAYDFSLRLGVSYLTVMQHVYQVHGRPSMEATLAIALVNASGLFVDPLDYEVVGTDAKNKDYKVRAFATRAATGTVLYGPWINWDLVTGEGWDKKQGSKWLTMPEQMFHYRAASWFQRRHCPEVTMGMMTTEEAAELEAVPFQKTKKVESKASTTERILDKSKGAEPPVMTPPAGDEKPKNEKPKRKRRTKAQIAADKKAKDEAEKADAEAQDQEEPTEAEEQQDPPEDATEQEEDLPQMRWQCKRCMRQLSELKDEKCPHCMSDKIEEI
jgi:hypothetical protein